MTYIAVFNIPESYELEIEAPSVKEAFAQAMQAKKKGWKLIMVRAKQD